LGIRGTVELRVFQQQRLFRRRFAVPSGLQRRFFRQRFERNLERGEQQQVQPHNRRSVAVTEIFLDELFAVPESVSDAVRGEDGGAQFLERGRGLQFLFG